MARMPVLDARRKNSTNVILRAFDFALCAVAALFVCAMITISSRQDDGIYFTIGKNQTTTGKRNHR